MFGGACMSEKLDFYEVNVDYVKYLKQFDSRIPNVEYQNRNKFLCGTLFKINGLNYFAPVSSFNIKQSSNYVIEVGNVPVGSVRYSFMFPVPDAEIKQKVINNESDYQYRFLLRQELKYCNKNREVIQSKAKQSITRHWIRIRHIISSVVIFNYWKKSVKNGFMIKP